MDKRNHTFLMSTQLIQVKQKQRDDCKTFFIFGILNLLVGLRSIDPLNVFTVIGISFLISPLVIFIFLFDLEKVSEYFPLLTFISYPWLIVISFRREGFLMGGFGAICVTVLFAYISAFYGDLLTEKVLLEKESEEKLCLEQLVEKRVQMKDHEIECLKASLKDMRHEYKEDLLKLREELRNQSSANTEKQNKVDRTMKRQQIIIHDDEEQKRQIDERLSQKIKVVNTIEKENQKNKEKKESPILNPSKREKSGIETWMQVFILGNTILNFIHSLKRLHK